MIDLENNFEELDNRMASYSMSDVVLACFSVVKRASFNSLREIWIPEVKRMCGKATPILIIGLQTELRD